MKYILAGKKADKAVDALIDLQQDYMDEVLGAKVEYELSQALDLINQIRTALDGMS